jgi:iron complex transport system substrate-binding protein
MIIKSFPSFRVAMLWLVLICTFTACRQKTSENNKSESVESGKNFYPEHVQITHAKGFSIAYHNHFKIVHIINPFDKGADTTRYLLLERGTEKPAGYDHYKLIEIPIRTLTAMSSMHVGLLGFLDSYDILNGLGNLQYVYAPEVIRRIDEGKIHEVGKDQGLNEEKLVTMHPDLIMTMGSAGGGMSHYQTLDKAGIPVMINSEWVETTPLARAEWVKLLAALLNKEQLVNQKFSVIEKEYNRLANLALQSKQKPTVISGLNTKDVWFLPGADSYMTRFLADAGSEYSWAKTKSIGSLSLAFEAVYPVALHADFWMNVGFDSKDTKKSILAMDSRYSDFAAYKSGKMYSYNGKVNDRGSNDFFESGTVNPQMVIADLIKIFHPELLPEHQLVYYKKLE